MTESERTGGCLCGAVRYKVTAAPVRVGLCHCGTCQKNTGSPYFAFAVFPRAAVMIEGTLKDVFAPTLARRICPECGTLVALEFQPTEIDLSLGSFDSPPDFTIEYEEWVGRRHPWLTPIEGAVQYAGTRVDGDEI